MKWRAATGTAAIVLALCVPSTAQGTRQSVVGQVEATPEEERTGELPSTMIGLEAFREVMLSGQYLVGPGDRFLIHVSESDEPLEVRVLAEGGVHIPKVGRIRVGGLRLGAAREAMVAAFRRAFRVGEVWVELSEPRRFPVPVVGMVRAPGLVVANAVQRVSEVVEKAEGLAENASTRNIRVLSTATLSREQAADLRQQAEAGRFGFLSQVDSRRADLELYYVTGDSEYNPFVEDGDIIVVPSSQSAIRGVGAVNRPGIFEFVEGDRVSDLLSLSMGFAPHVDMSQVFLFRYQEEGTRQISQALDTQSLLTGDPVADVGLRPGDWLVARETPEFQPTSTVHIVGEVRYPGHYVVGREGVPLRDVIAWAGDFTRVASLPKSRVYRQLTATEVVDPEFDRVVSIPAGDRTEEEKQYFNMKSRERRGQMVVDFISLFEDEDETQNLLLRAGDVVQIPTLQSTVLVSGQAAHPGALVFDPDYAVGEYIDLAGGPGWRASSDVRVIKARTGEIISANNVASMDPGDRIWIKEKPVRDYWSIFTQAMEVVGQVSTLVLLYATLR